LGVLAKTRERYTSQRSKEIERLLKNIGLGELAIVRPRLLGGQSRVDLFESDPHLESRKFWKIPGSFSGEKMRKIDEILSNNPAFDSDPKESISWNESRDNIRDFTGKSGYLNSKNQNGSRKKNSFHVCFIVNIALFFFCGRNIDFSSCETGRKRSSSCPWFCSSKFSAAGQLLSAKHSFIYAEYCSNVEFYEE
jgi:hypothetical protein